ncbi:hypothetical protein HGRIS_005437 [Hohenbuehelia grisea]|uniref:Amino acid permease/ SLC12A domain-containing protein n=1 Tax=Hohenbuehelia grisea TaxID=104357 RepID=A0ABR3JXY9_9AGAR
MPAAIKGTFWRITIIYITSLAIIGLLLPGASVSPFVIALDRAGIKGINHLINATICVSVLSIGLSCVYAGSRTLTALAETGYAPKVFTYGRPLFSVLAILAFAPIAYVNVRAAGDTVFTWLLALSGLSTLFTWLSICLCHIRFRKAWTVQGHLIDELPFKALGGVWGSWFGVILITLVLIAQFYVVSINQPIIADARTDNPKAIWPIEGMAETSQEVAEGFFSECYRDMAISHLEPQRHTWLRLSCSSSGSSSMRGSVRSPCN